MRRITVVLVAVVACMFGVTVREAVAQDARSTIRVPDDVIAEIQRAIDQSIDAAAKAATQAAVIPSVNLPALQEIPREIALALRDVASDLQGLDALRGIDLDALVHESVRALADARVAGAIGEQGDGRVEQIDRQTKTLTLGAAGEINVQNISGDVTVVAGTGPNTTIDIVRRSRARTAADAKLGLDRVPTTVEEHSGHVSIHTVYPNELRPPYSVSVTYTITTPAGTAIVARVTAGDVKITGIHGDIAVSGVSGDIAITNAARVSEVKTISGDVTLTGIDSDGTITAEAVSGHVTARQVKARRVELTSTTDSVIAADVTCDSASLHSFTGSVEFSGAFAAHGRYEFQTQSGSVHVMVDGKTGFEFDAKTFSGDIHADLPLQAAATEPRALRRSLHGTFGDGSASVTVTTFSGNVTLGKK